MSFTAKITADITKFEQNIGKAIDSTNRLEKTVSQKLTNMGDSFVNAGKKASILSAALVAAGTKAFMMAADFEDAIGATGQIFNENADIVKGWADTLGTEYGIAKKEALEYSNLMGSMLINIGKLTEEQAARQSAKLIELAGDLTAMYGGRTQDAVRALTGALKGNNTMLDNYGMAVNDALVKTKAFEMGLSDGTGELSLQAKQAATLALIYEQTTAAQGQAAREADGASGAMRALTTEVKNLSTELGEVLLPVITPVVAGIRDMVANVRGLSPEMQKTIVVVGGIAAAIGPLLVGLGSVLKMLPLIKAAMIAVSGPIGLVVAAVAGAALLIISNWDEIKEYFTSGGGAELFNTIKFIAVEIKDFLVGSWNDIKDLGITIWNAIGSDVINIVKNVFSNITSILTVLVKTFRNVAQILHGIFTLDFKFALDGLKNLFLDIFKGLTDIAFNALSTISGLLATFFDWVGLDKWAASVNNFSNKIAEMVRPSVQATDAIEEVGESADKTKTSVDNLATSFKELGEAQEAATAKIAPDDVTGVSVLAPVIEPTIDAQGLKEKLRDTTYGALADLGEGIKVLTIDLSSMLSGALTDVFGSVADAMMNGDNMMAALGASLLGTLGGIMVQLGQMVIATGSAIEAVKAALSSLGGIGAIAAGVALIAIGSLFKAGASKLSRSMGSGGGYSSAPSMNNTSPSYGPSEYRGAYQDDFQVTFKIGTNELVGGVEHGRAEEEQDMIFRLEYCNKASFTARVDIQKGGATPIYTVEGTSEPFALFYNNDKGDKSGSFRSSGADINIYKTTEFNIDKLKTSNETEISVKYYINNVLDWSGFVIPDFFSETITGGQGVVSMVASDRLGTLKGATLSGLSAKVSNRSLAEACLAQTGLSLPLYTMADFTGDGTNIFNSEVLSQRMIDTKGRNVSCYDILSSILEETNSLIVQQNGAWYIVNKLQLEAGVGSLYSAPATSSAWVENTVSFDEVSVGARRTIIPVAAAVGVYHEHGGGRLYPDNHDFSLGLNGWIENSGFNAVVDNRKVDEFILSGGAYIPDYGEETSNSYLVNRNYIYMDLAGRAGQPRLSATDISVVGNNPKEVSMSLDVNMTGKNNTRASISVCVFTGSRRIWLNKDGVLQNIYTVIDVYFKDESKQDTSAIMAGLLLNTTIKADNDEDDVTDYHVEIDIYGAGGKTSYAGGEIIYDITVLVNSISVRFSSTSAELPKGNIFKTTQGANYTKDHEIPTVLWGDYLASGLNGYFYTYPIDDTSSLYRPTGELHSRWTAYGDPDTLPLLQHITRQKARMFSVAHDLLSADIATSTFDPLSIFVDCDNTRYVVVSARFDFLRSNVSVELEEIAYVKNSKRDYIYSYFGDGEDGISSIGGISGGTTSTGGGLTSEQLAILNNLASWWKLDEVNDAIYSEKNVYSQKGVSAYGLGDEGSGSVDLSKLLSWAGYTSEMADYYAPASLLVPFRDDTLSRLESLEAGGGGGGGSTVTWGTESGGYIPLTVEGASKSVALSTHTHSQYALTTHNHSGVYEPVFTKNTAFNKDFGTTSTTVARGNHTHSQYALTTHNHSGVYEPAFTKNTAFNKDFGTTSTTVARGNHTHSGVYEPVFTKNTAFNKDFGTTSGTVAQGNDSRIVNGQTAYGWGNHASAGYALSTHNHSGVYEPVFSKNTAFNKAFGTTSGTVAQGNDSRIVNGQTAYGWGDHASAGYVTLATSQTITGAKTFSANLTASVSVTTPKVIFAAAGWSMDQSTEGVLELKYNGVVKQKFLNDGSIAATGELTAYVAGASGYSEFLPLSGGTLTGNLNIGTGVIIGTAAIPLSVRGSTFKYNNSDVLYKGNIGTASLPSIGLSDGWTIEVQTTPSSALLIKKNGVIKGTFNA